MTKLFFPACAGSDRGDHHDRDKVVPEVAGLTDQPGINADHLVWRVSGRRADCDLQFICRAVPSPLGAMLFDGHLYRSGVYPHTADGICGLHVADSGNMAAGQAGCSEGCPD